MKVISAILFSLLAVNLTCGFVILSILWVAWIAENVSPLVSVLAGVHLLAVPVFAFLYYKD